MNAVAWLAFGAAAIVTISAIAIVVRTAGRRSNEELSAVRQEMQNSLALQGQSVAAQINHLMQAVTTQLGQVRQELQSGVASSGKLASDAQVAMAQQLQASSETIRKMSAQLGEVQQAEPVKSAVLEQPPATPPLADDRPGAVGQRAERPEQLVGHAQQA